ncbi:hypothetical protein EGI32_04265 [Ferruginibacter sp. HRS2-29]|nr:hypothetical protein [Ferruginibacter sp. HRS2-29]
MRPATGDTAVQVPNSGRASSASSSVSFLQETKQSSPKNRQKMRESCCKTREVFFSMPVILSAGQWLLKYICSFDLVKARGRNYLLSQKRKECHQARRDFLPGKNEWILSGSRSALILILRPR